MARAPPPTIDFAPAWLNFNNSNKKPEKPASAVSASSFLSNSSTSHSFVGSTKRTYTRSPTRGPSVANSSLDNYYRSFTRHDSVDSDRSWSGYGRLANSAFVSEGKEPTPKYFNSKWPSFNGSNGRSNHHSEDTVHYLHPEKRNNTLDFDFPSLGNDALPSPTCPQTSILNQPNNMWNKPLVLKPNGDDSDTGAATKATCSKPNPNASNIYKNFVPKSNVNLAKQPYRRTTSVPVGMPPVQVELKSYNSAHNYGNTKMLSVATSMTSVKGRESPKSPNPGMSVLEDTSTIPTVKRHRKGKSIFLKDLRQDDTGSLSAENLLMVRHAGNDIPDDYADVAASPVQDPSLDDDKTTDMTEQDVQKDSYEDDDDKVGLANVTWQSDEITISEAEDGVGDQETKPPVLSSSLEAEHRLLREMGWKQVDEEEADALTDAEIREFFLQNKPNGILAVPSPSYRAAAFRNALSTWSRSGPPVLRQINEQEKIDVHKATDGGGDSSSEISPLSFSDFDSDIEL